MLSIRDFGNSGLFSVYLIDWLVGSFDFVASVNFTMLYSFVNIKLSLFQYTPFRCCGKE